MTDRTTFLKTEGKQKSLLLVNHYGNTDMRTQRNRENYSGEKDVTDWLETVDGPVIRIDGTLPVEKNVDDLVSVFSKEDFR